MFREKPQREQSQPQLEKVEKQNRDDIGSTLCRDTLPADLLKIYNTIDEYAYYNRTQSFWLNGADRQDFDIALEAYLFDNPQVFWLDTQGAYSYYQDSENLEVELNFVFQDEELAAAKQTFKDAVEKVLSLAPDDADDLETEVYFNDYLVEHCQYDAQGDMCHTAYGALVDGSAVCDGYSYAFQLLCNKSGIECTVIEGNSDFNQDDDLSHMWNCVKLDDNWYHVDVTWNDSNNAKFFCEKYFYLNLNSEEILLDHIIYPLYNSADYDGKGDFNIFVPECTATELNYLTIYCPVIQNLDDDEAVAASMISAVNNGEHSCAVVIDPSLPFKETAETLIYDGYISNWIVYANRFIDSEHQIALSSNAYTFEDNHVLVIQLEYD